MLYMYIQSTRIYGRGPRYYPQPNIMFRLQALSCSAFSQGWAWIFSDRHGQRYFQLVMVMYIISQLFLSQRWASIISRGMGTDSLSHRYGYALLSQAWARILFRLVVAWIFLSSTQLGMGMDILSQAWAWIFSARHGHDSYLSQSVAWIFLCSAWALIFSARHSHGYPQVGLGILQIFSARHEHEYSQLGMSMDILSQAWARILSQLVSGMDFSQLGRGIAILS